MKKTFDTLNNSAERNKPGLVTVLKKSVSVVTALAVILNMSCNSFSLKSDAAGATLMRSVSVHNDLSQTFSEHNDISDCNEEGQTCSKYTDSYVSDSIACAKLSDDGWYYCDILPENVTSDNYDIEYKNYYQTIQETHPGGDWEYVGIYSSEWVNSGDPYKSWYELATSDSRVLIDSYYYHYCSATTGTVVNYEMTSEYIHYDSVPLHLAEVERTGLDGDIIYYVLKWISNGTRIYCNSNSTCDGTYGTHGDRSYAWYKMHIYQDKVQIVKNLYSRSSDWGNTIDASANSVSYRFKAKASVVPQNVKATAGNKKVTLSWTEVSGATKYRVQRLNGTTWSTISYPATNSYVDTDVTNGTTYKYRVLAYVNGAWGTASSVVSAKPFNATPQNVKATAGDKNVKLTWTKVSGATKYRVQRLNGTTWSTINYPTTNSYTDTGLKNDTTYKYRVLAYVNGAWSTASSAVSAKPFNTTPKNVKATAGDKNVKIAWTKVSGATKYRVQRLNGTTWSTVNYPATNSYTDTGLTNGTTYKYRVLAYVNGAWSTASSAVSAKPFNTTPKNVKATAGDKKVTLSWTAVSGATKYRVQRLNGTTWSTVNYPATNSYTDTGLTNGTTYKYRVLAYVNGAWSTASSAVSATPNAVDTIPKNVRAVGANKRVTITWTAVTGATKYRVQRTTGTSWTTVNYPTATTYVDTDVINGTTYKYRVLAYVNGVWSTPSSVVSAIPVSSGGSSVIG